VARLVAAANEAGGRDNVTVVLVQLTGPGDDVLT
jgi:serine/threonine protein phosphatase PrpC